MVGLTSMVRCVFHFPLSPYHFILQDNIIDKQMMTINLVEYMSAILLIIREVRFVISSSFHRE